MIRIVYKFLLCRRDERGGRKRYFILENGAGSPGNCWKKKRSEPATTDWRLGGWVGKNGGQEEGVGVGRVELSEGGGGDGGEVAREGCRSQSWVPSV